MRIREINKIGIRENLENDLKIIVLFGETWGNNQEIICIFQSIDSPLTGVFIINYVIVLDMRAPYSCLLKILLPEYGTLYQSGGNENESLN